MLYDPKWEVKTNPLSLRGLISWLEQQPGETEYSYVNPFDCLLCRYFRACGFEDVAVAVNCLSHKGGDVRFPSEMRDASFSKRIDTYGAALRRARNIAAKSR